MSFKEGFLFQKSSTKSEESVIKIHMEWSFIWQKCLPVCVWILVPHHLKETFHRNATFWIYPIGTWNIKHLRHSVLTSKPISTWDNNNAIIYMYLHNTIQTYFLLSKNGQISYIPRREWSVTSGTWMVIRVWFFTLKTEDINSLWQVLFCFVTCKSTVPS